MAEETITVPEGTVKIALEVDSHGGSAYEDRYEVEVNRLELWAHLENGSAKIIWQGSWQDYDDWSAHWKMREELKKVFLELGLDINEVIDLESSCVLDWEYPKWDR